MRRSLKEELAPNRHIGIKKDEVRTFNGLKGELVTSSVFQQPPGKDRLWVSSVSGLFAALGRLWERSLP